MKLADYTALQQEILRQAAGRWDRSLASGDRRSYARLIRDGLIAPVLGLGTDRRGETVYDVVTDWKITDAGLALVRAAENS